MEFAVEVLDPLRRMRLRVLDRDIPFGGTWTLEVSPDGEGRARGHAATIEEYLQDLGRRLGVSARAES